MYSMHTIWMKRAIFKVSEIKFQVLLGWALSFLLLFIWELFFFSVHVCVCVCV